MTGRLGDEAFSSCKEFRFKQLNIRKDIDNKALWVYMNPVGRACFNKGMLQDIIDFGDLIVNSNGFFHADDAWHAIKYIIWGSAVPGIFNLGGDLDFFQQSIRERNSDKLLEYGRMCVNPIAKSLQSYGQPIITIALVQGLALGGGLECALANHFIVAEKRCMIGLPEIMFNLFPGMGAYHMLSRKLGESKARRFIMDGAQGDAEALYELGLIDKLADIGNGENEVRKLIAHLNLRFNGNQAILRQGNKHNAITLTELEDGVAHWVNTAMNLADENLAHMSTLVKRQNRKMQQIS